MSTDGKINILCTAGPPCSYLCMGGFWECSFDGICQFQRPLRVNISQQGNAADGFRTCPDCGRVDERVICQACGGHLTRP